MKIIEDYIGNNFNSKVSREIKYIVIHYTAGVSSKAGRAKSTRDYFNKKEAQASAHYIVDDETIIHAVRDKDVAWHCGSKKYKHAYCRNSNSIGIEVCSNHDSFKSYEANPATDKGWYFTKEALENTSQLVRYLMDEYNIGIECVLMHYDVTGKWCPAPLLNKTGFTWGDFLEMLDEKESSIPDYAKNPIKWYIDNGYLKGKESGLGLSEDMIRILVIFYRIFKDKGWM